MPVNMELMPGRRVWPVDDELVLASYMLDDRDDLYNLIDQNRDHLRDWLPWVDKYTEKQEAVRYIQGVQMQVLSTAGFMSGGIFYRGELVGGAGFVLMHKEHRNATIGYWLSKSHTGRGIMTRIVRMLVEESFNELDLHRIEIRVATGNKRSAAIPERLGFQVEGVIREAEWLYDHFVDHRIYGLLKREWMGPK